MSWVLFAIVVIGGAIGLGRAGRQRMLAAADPSTAGPEGRDEPGSTLLAPQIDWSRHNPLRRQ